MASFIVAPSNFSNGESLMQLNFPISSVNAFVKSRTYDTFDFYQSTFGMYGYMQFTKNLTFRLHWIRGNRFVWQPHNDCSWTPTSGRQEYSTEITPTAVKLNEQFCYDELFESTFKAFVSWNNAAVEMDANGVELTNNLVQDLIQNATIAARATMAAGKLAVLQGATFTPGDLDLPNLQTNFNTSLGVHKGWLQGLVDYAAANPTTAAHCNISGLFSGYTDPTGQTFVGDVVDFFTKDIYSKMPKSMQKRFAQGGMVALGNGTPNPMPIFWATWSILKRVKEQYEEENSLQLSNKKRIEKREYPWGNSMMFVYYIDDIPVIPLDDVDVFADQVEGTYHAAYATYTGNVQLGGSFRGIPTIGTPESSQGLAFVLQMSKLAKDYGQTYILAHYLMANGICDTNLIAGGQDFQAL